MLEQRPVTHKQFRIYRLLGRGGFGEVYAVQRRETGKMYAMKCMNKKRLISRGATRLALNERNFLERIRSRVSCARFWLSAT